MIKQIFWDCDGTLVNTEPVFFQATKEVFSDVGVEITIDWWANVILVSGCSSFDLLRDRGFSEEKIEGLRGKRNQLYLSSLTQEVKVMEGVYDVLEKLYGKIPMAVVSSSLRENLEHILDSKALMQYFDFYIPRDGFVEDKPAPECYLHAWEQVNLPKNQCLVIEDTERGVRAAKDAGLVCYAIPNELTKKHDFSQADKILKNANDIKKWVI